MKREREIALAAMMCVAMAACGGGNHVESYTSSDGKTQAIHNTKTGEWKITDKNGVEMMADYDSMRVVAVSEDGHPETVIYHKGERQHWVQYYSTMELRSEGDVVSGSREGHWVYYHPSGIVQAECDFVGGLEEGAYKVYRENGVPYYVGQYKAGKRVGRWEFYDNDGRLAQTKDYAE